MARAFGSASARFARISTISRHPPRAAANSAVLPEAVRADAVSALTRMSARLTAAGSAARAATYSSERPLASISLKSLTDSHRAATRSGSRERAVSAGQRRRRVGGGCARIWRFRGRFWHRRSDDGEARGGFWVDGGRREWDALSPLTTALQNDRVGISDYAFRPHPDGRQTVCGARQRQTPKSSPQEDRILYIGPSEPSCRGRKASQACF